MALSYMYCYATRSHVKQTGGATFWDWPSELRRDDKLVTSVNMVACISLKVPRYIAEIIGIFLKEFDPVFDLWLNKASTNIYSQ